MSRAQAIAPLLPFLRRHARALTGSQQSGDAHVRACLEALVADPTLMSEDMPPRVALFRVFHAMWRGVTRPELVAETLGARPVNPEQRIGALVPERRQALLLTALEGFTPEQAAQIMDTDPAGIRALVDQALTDITREMGSDVLIIEDEPAIALDLAEIVRGLGHEVTAMATTRDEAVAAAKMHRPDLVLADIQLADNSSGIDAVKRILGDGVVPVIFITAYPERLLTGERPEPTFLITKPFLPDAVKATISQALFFNTAARPAAA